MPKPPKALCQLVVCLFPVHPELVKGSFGGVAKVRVPHQHLLVRVLSSITSLPDGARREANPVLPSAQLILGLLPHVEADVLRLDAASILVHGLYVGIHDLARSLVREADLHEDARQVHLQHPQKPCTVTQQTTVAVSDNRFLGCDTCLY